mmetsp:Transcript_11730/g.22317  ORF Transcript_11730/g.22317 Transcript_11730/m.22317 type:complete len:1744 (-) Transcript_11730:31-5262(-)
MQLRHLKTIHNPAQMVDGTFQKITALAWSPNNLRLAVATIDRYIILYDDKGEQIEKFSTKPGNKKAPRNYLVRTLAFSPDSTKLAVAQSDNIVFIYKLGANWGDKKTICNKFTQSSPVTCLCWPHGRSNEVVFGLADGKLRIGILRNNKSALLFNTDSYVVSCAAGPDGQSFVSGHLDGSVYRYTFPDQDGPVQAQLTQTPFVPTSLGWGEHVVAAGNTGVVQFYDLQGQQVQQFDYRSDDKVKEFSSLAFNPSGQTVVLGNFDRFYTYVFNTSKGCWEEASCTVVENLYTVTALCWKADGSRLVTGSLCGAVDTYDACIRRYLYRGKYEFTYTSLSSVIVKRLSTGARMALKSKFEIKKINIFQDRYLAAHTVRTLMVGDLQTTSLSEVEWGGAGKEKFFFDNENACMVFNAGELSLVEYGNNTILGSLRTEYMSPHLISLRLNEARNKNEAAVKKIAYLLDSQAVRVLDLVSGVSESTYSHDCKIDWLELNQRATKLLFRDKRRALHLYDVASQTRTTLLNFCNYVQWVPDSDVVVAQMRKSLCVWYSIDNPSEMTTLPIKGDVEEIERTAGRTEVLIDEGIDTTSIALDENLIAFGSAVDGKDFKRAVAILEGMPKGSIGGDAMWSQLSKLALEDNNTIIAERCAAALGDVSRAHYLHKLNQLVAESGGNTNLATVKCQLSVLNKQFKRAEVALLQQGHTDVCIDMYRNLHKWNDALLVAEGKSHPATMALRQEYYEYLLATKQEEIAGDLKEREGDYNTALQLYLKGGYPAKAADLVLNHDLRQDTNLTERVADALVKTKQYEKAGVFLESLDLHKRALDAYCRGHSYFKAVDLARRAFPSNVVRLEEEWGDFLIRSKQMDAASNHYIQAGAYLKAIDAALGARQWTKAVQILDQIDHSTAKPYFKRIAQHYAETKRFEEAEKYFIQGDLHHDAVQMYTSAGLWDKAHKIAVTYMPKTEVSMLYVTQAKKMESQGKFKDAERLYLTVSEPDLAISMYKKNRHYDDMIRLVTQWRKELLTETNIHLATQFQEEGNFKLAEKHYLAANEWKPVVSMYRENDMWEDCLRVAKQKGGQKAYKQVMYACAVAVGGDAGVKLLAKRGLGAEAVEYAIERAEFTEAFHIAEKCCKAKLPEVHLQYAMALEDEGRFDKAEEEFIKAKKPKEAIDMYKHQQDWDACMRVAEQHEPAAIADVQEAHGKARAEQKDFQGAEQLFLSAKKPEAAVKMYKENGRWDDAMRLAKKFVPMLINTLQEEKLSGMSSTSASGGLDYLVQQAQLLENQKNYRPAIDAYLKITKDATSDSDQLERLWENAVNIAMDHVPERASEVVSIVGSRLKSIQKFEGAAVLYMAVENYRDAVDAYVQGGMFEKARLLVANSAPQFSDMVENAYKGNLMKSGNTAELANHDSDAAIEMYVAKGQWSKVYELASKQGESVTNKFATIHAKTLVQDKKFKEALAVFAKRGVPAIPANFGLYKRITQEVLTAADEKTMDQADTASGTCPDEYSQLKDLLYKLTTELNELMPNDPKTEEFNQLALIAHFNALRLQTFHAGLKPLSAKLAISLLRYTKEIPADKAYFDAGMQAQDLNQLNMAFVFLNRFVDLSDLVDDPDSGDIDNTDFLETDLPSPLDVPLPPKHFYSEDVREEAREWVLEKAMSNNVNQAVNQRACDKCNVETYEAALVCHSCKDQSEACIVTGFPIMRNRRCQCKACGKPANKDDWNMYVAKMKTCPWCQQLQNPSY